MLVASLFHLVFTWAMPESPEFLMAKHRYSEVHKTMEYISYLNGCPEGTWDHKFAAEVSSNDVINTQPQQQEVTLWGAFKDKIFRTNLLVMSLNWTVASLSFYIVGFYIGSFPGDIYTNAFIVIVANLLSTLATKLVLTYSNLKNGFTLSWLFVMALSCTFCMFYEYIVIEYICVFIVAFGVNLSFSL